MDQINVVVPPPGFQPKSNQHVPVSVEVPVQFVEGAQTAKVMVDIGTQTSNKDPFGPQVNVQDNVHSSPIFPS